MKGYLITNLDIHDEAAFQRYRDKVLPLIRQYGGRNLIRGGELETLEGDLGIKQLVLLEFPSMEAARAFYDSPEYQPLKDMRLQCAHSDVALIAGQDEA